MKKKKIKEKIINRSEKIKTKEKNVVLLLFYHFSPRRTYFFQTVSVLSV